MRKALDPPGQARDDIGSSRARATPRTRLGAPDGRAGLGRAAHAQPDAWRHELRPARRARRDPVAVPDRGSPGLTVLARPAVEGPGSRVRRAVHRCAVRASGRRTRRRFPDPPDHGAAVDSYNTGVQSNLYSSPLRRGETLDLSPEDAERLGRGPGEVVRVSARAAGRSKRRCGSTRLRPGLAFMTFHFPDEIDVNVLTIDATDPKSGTAEFKATAIRVEKLAGRAPGGGVGGRADGARETAIAWTSASSTPRPRDGRARGRRRFPRAARRRMGRGAIGRGRARRARRPRGARASATTAADAPARPGADRLDQPRRADYIASG